MIPRPHIPLRVKLEAALLQLGLDPATAERHHDPALCLRERAAAVAHLRTLAKEYRLRAAPVSVPLTAEGCMAYFANLLQLTADRIERGEHRSN